MRREEQIQVSAYEKTEFLDWILDKYKLNKRRAAVLLREVIDFAGDLDRVEFKERVYHCPHGLLVAIDEQGRMRLFFYNDGGIMEGHEDIRQSIKGLLAQGETLYIEFQFPDRQKHLEYVNILTYNEYDFSQRIKDKELTENFLEYSLVYGKIERIKSEIDKALDNKDFETAKELSEKIKKIDLPDRSFDLVNSDEFIRS